MPGVGSSRLGRPLQRGSQGVSHGVICNDSANRGIQPNDHICCWPPAPLPQTYLCRLLRMLTPSFYCHQALPRRHGDPIPGSSFTPDCSFRLTEWRSGCSQRLSHVGYHPGPPSSLACQSLHCTLLRPNTAWGVEGFQLQFTKHTEFYENGC